VILSIVNKFLSLGNENVFSCLDMAIIDLKTGAVDFVKLGATNGYIKHKDTISVIQCNALPLGIVTNIVPTIKSTIVEAGDMIIITTDGVTDSFSSDDEMTDFVNNISTYNPQEVADALMDKALENNHNIALDDMTILVAKLF
jgi:stage II sporulation protein E